jgi:GntR family transcriptional regulator, transcriptional repressor for pyruvate dehydrogenase complex
MVMTRATLSTSLETQIVSGRLAAGEKLPSERQLAEQYGVSRPIVREALRSLVERDLVEIKPGRGSYVRDARPTAAAGRLDALYRRSQATPRDLVEARTMLECTAADLAAQRASPADLAAIERALAAFDRSSGILEQARYDMAFHLAVARAARNPVIETMFGSITALTVELMLRSLSDPDVTRLSVPYHLQIYEGIRDHDPVRARTAMARHLAVATSHYGDDYDRSIESVARRELERLLAPGVTLDDLLAAVGADGRGDGRTDRG